MKKILCHRSFVFIDLFTQGAVCAVGARKALNDLALKAFVGLHWLLKVQFAAVRRDQK